MRLVDHVRLKPVGGTQSWTQLGGTTLEIAQGAVDGSDCSAQPARPNAAEAVGLVGGFR